MAELAVSSTDTVKLIRPQAVIARAKTAVTAFIGRALKGPLNQPVRLQGFDDYRRVFGGLWQPSTLSYAIEQFFENGGEECLVVRVCNGGRAPTLRLATEPGAQTGAGVAGAAGAAGGATHAPAAALTLIGLAPGTREFLRASVDYDGIEASDTDRFNLVVQRVRTPGSELIEEQEIFRRISIRPGAERSVLAALTASRLVRVLGALPPSRPARSASVPPAVGYTGSSDDGDDGEPLTSYDIIGEADKGTGLFALQNTEPFSLLCIPPLTRERDVALPALLVALRLCRERQAMLLLDPPLDWTDAATACRNLRSWPFFSEDALMFYPRITAFDRLRGREEIFACAPSAAGLLAQASARRPVWSAAADDELLLRAGMRPSVLLSDLDQLRLTQAGVNVLQAQRAAQRSRLGLRTLRPEAAGRSDWRFASARRLALFIMTSVEQGTRWALFEPAGPALWGELCTQVTGFFAALQDEGAFVGARAEDSYFVICDQRLNDPARASGGGGGVQLLIGFAIVRPGEFHTCLVDHRHAGSSVRAVSVNRWALPRPV